MDRVRAGCTRPALASMLDGAEVVDESGDVLTVRFASAQRAAATAHLAELKPLFVAATGRRGLEVVIDGAEVSSPGAAPAAPATRADAGLDHPLVRRVAELFEATPKRVELRSKS